MQITKQQSINECGVCVINSFVKHYYHHSSKQQILEEANLSETGLSIFDFETLGQKFGLFIESYECEWAEFTNLKNNEFYSLLTNKNGGLHYIIVYKTKSQFKVFDSLKESVYYASYKELSKEFAGIIFEITKSKTKIKYTNKKIDLQSIDFKFLSLSLFLHLCIIGLSTLFANLLNWTLNISVYPKSTTNLIAICFVFILIFGLNIVINYILKFYCLMMYKQNYRYLTYKLIKCIKNKKKDFVNKIDSNSIFLIDSSIAVICSYLTSEITGLITDIIMLIIASIIFLAIKPIFLVFCIVNIFVSVFIGILNYFFKEKNMNQIIKNSNFNSQVSKELIEFIKNEENSEILDFLVDKYKNNFFQFERIYTKKASFDNNIFSVEQVVNNLVYVLMIAIGAFLLMNEKLNIGTFTFLISLLSMFNGSCNNVCMFPTKQKEYSKMSDVYWYVVNLSNLKDDSTIKNTNEIKSLEFKSAKNKISVLNGSVIDNQNVSIDNLMSINNQSNNKFLFKNNFVKINPNSNIPIEYVRKNFDPQNKELVDLIQFFKINLGKESFNASERQIINFIFSFLMKNKIICYNDCFKYLTNSQTKYVKDKINNYVLKNNFVFFINS